MSVLRKDHVLELKLAEGALQLRVAGGFDGALRPHVAAAVALERMIEARRDAADSADATDANHLALRARSYSDWMRVLTPHASGGYRRPPQLDAEGLSTTLGDPAVASDVRLGAAIALVNTDPAGDRTRIRVAASATVDPALSRALVRVADDAFDETAFGEFETSWP